jgi:hypothetical protein
MIHSEKKTKQNKNWVTGTKQSRMDICDRCESINMRGATQKKVGEMNGKVADDFMLDGMKKYEKRATRGEERTTR